MSKRYFATIPNACAILDTSAAKVCLPIKVECGINPDGIITICGMEHNCSSCCNDAAYKYYMPYRFGDTFYFETQIFDKYNPDPKNPVDGFGTWIEYDIIDTMTGLSVNTAPLISEYYVGWNGFNSYQVIKVYMANGEISECWQLKLKVYDSEDVLIEEYCSQEFRREDDCSNTILIGSDRKGFDCERNYYGLPTASSGTTPFEYNNQLRFYADVTDVAPIRETTTRDGLQKKVRIKYIKEYSLYFVPLYVVKYLTNRIESNGKVKIDGKYYDVEFSDVEKVEDTCMYNIKLNIIYECKEENC